MPPEARIEVAPCRTVTDKGEFLGAGNACFPIWVLVTWVCSVSKNSSCCILRISTVFYRYETSLEISNVVLLVMTKCDHVYNSNSKLLHMIPVRNPAKIVYE